MESKLFRKKSIERVSSPEQLNDYIRVTSPSVWLIMSAMVFLLLGICVWGIFGKLDTVLPVGVMTENGRTVCYIRESDRETVTEEMPVKIQEETYAILEIAQNPVQVDESYPEYLLHVGELTPGEWVYEAVLTESLGTSGAIFPGGILVESIAPMHFIVN